MPPPTPSHAPSPPSSPSPSHLHAAPDLEHAPAHLHAELSRARARARAAGSERVHFVISPASVVGPHRTLVGARGVAPLRPRPALSALSGRPGVGAGAQRADSDAEQEREERVHKPAAVAAQTHESRPASSTSASTAASTATSTSTFTLAPFAPAASSPLHAAHVPMHDAPPPPYAATHPAASVSVSAYTYAPAPSQPQAPAPFQSQAHPHQPPRPRDARPASRAHAARGRSRRPKALPHLLWRADAAVPVAHAQELAQGGEAGHAHQREQAHEQEEGTQAAAPEQERQQEQEHDRPKPILSRLPAGALAAWAAASASSRASKEDDEDEDEDEDADADEAYIDADVGASAGAGTEAQGRAIAIEDVARQPQGYLRWDAASSPTFPSASAPSSPYPSSATAPLARASVLYTRARLPAIDAPSLALWRALHAFRPKPGAHVRGGYLALRGAQAGGNAGGEQQQGGQKGEQAPHPVAPGANADQCPAFSASQSFGSAATLSHLRASFNWASLPPLPPSLTGAWYGVAFRSARRAGSDGASLYAADRRAHEEAVASGGLLLYWYDVPDARTGENLATCVWASRADALKASRLPLHAIAAKEAQQAFEAYDLYRYRLVKRVGETSLRLEAWVDDE